MAGTWRQLIPHLFAMLVLYSLGVVAVYTAFDVWNFWVSLAIALAIALIYPSIARSFGFEPEAWRHNEDESAEQ